ncbi:MAG TPA: hypothetical protein VFW33_10525, partial [Gemmataceae bacterium]|nr:hypothetical protein [Gemmataceae bacterium]
LRVAPQGQGDAMSFLLPLVAGCALLPVAQAEKPVTLRYVLPEMGKLVTAAEVTTTRGDDGTFVTIKSERPDEKMTVTLRYDRDGKLTAADAVQGRKGVTLTLGEKGTGTMKRGGITDLLKDLPANPVVAAGPDWADVLQVVRRYDGAKGGKQEIAGFSIDPVQGFQKQKFTAETLPPVTIAVKDKEMKLDRYRLKVRGGDYAAWADGDGRVVRLQGVARGAVPVVLDGFEDATRGLKP